MSDTDSSATATFAGGCFWCVEAAFDELAGVESTVSGYAGGHVDDPSYEAVCSGDTGHAEVVQVGYDSDRVSYEDLLAVGSRVVDLERHFNNQRGIDRADDTLPYSLPDFEAALDEYYERRGWTDDGVVPEGRVDVAVSAD